jgi:hypothetical protein
MSCFSLFPDFVLLFQEINFLVQMKGSFLVVDQTVVDAVGFTNKGKGSSSIIVNEAVAVGAYGNIDIGYSIGDGSVPCNFGINDSHFSTLVCPNTLVRTG